MSGVQQYIRVFSDLVLPLSPGAGVSVSVPAGLLLPSAGQPLLSAGHYPCNSQTPCHTQEIIYD